MGGRAGLDCGDGGVAEECAREVRQQVPLGVDYEVPLQGVAGSGGGAGAGSDPADVPDARRGGRAGGGGGGSHAHAGVGVTAPGPVEAGAVREGAVVEEAAG